MGYHGIVPKKRSKPVEEFLWEPGSVSHGKFMQIQTAKDAALRSSLVQFWVELQSPIPILVDSMG